MKRLIWTTTFILGVFFGAIGETNACNVRPVPVICGGSTKYAAAGSVSFDGGCSYDSDGQVVAWKWDLDNDGTFEETGETVSKTFSVGTYTVKLMVKDDYGDWCLVPAAYSQTVKVLSGNITAYKRDLTAVPDDDEISPGAYVADNSCDDDDADGVTDIDDDDVRVSGVTKENDMVKVHFAFSGFSGLSTGKVVIRLQRAYLRLWRYDYKGTEIEFVDVGDDRYEKAYNLGVPAEKLAFENEIKDKDLWAEGNVGVDSTPLSVTYRPSSGPDVLLEGVSVRVFSAYIDVYKRDETTHVGLDDRLDPGAYVGYNDDDDDEDGGGTTADWDDDDIRKDGTPKEDDMMKVIFIFDTYFFAGLETGYVVIKRDNTKIKLWKNEFKGGADKEIVFDSAGGTEKVYNLADADDRYEFRQHIWPEETFHWVEGYQASGAAKDTGLTLTYLDPDGVDVCVDEVKITAITVDLDIDGVADEAETTTGGFIALNDDDDDDNGTADNGESGPITGEDNLIKITLRAVVPTSLTGSVTLKAKSGGSKIKVWTSSTKGTEVTLPKTYSTPSALPKDLWVEGYSASSIVRDVKLALEYTVEGQTFDDEVKLTVISIDSMTVDSSDTSTHKIDSVLPAVQVPDDHFVTVKGTGDIVLKTTITPSTDETKNVIGWTNMTQDPADKLKAKKSRGTSGKYAGTINVSGKTAKSFINWVVWSTASSSANAISETVQSTQTIISGGYDVTHTITPSDIITQSDRPALGGAKVDDPPDVPSGDIGVYNKGVNLGGGADERWDSSRQLKQKIVDPFSVNPPGPSKFRTTYPNYPSDDTCGNDDEWTTDPEDNNPYSAPHAGAVYGHDNPSDAIPHSVGALNETYEIRIHMRGFVRLNIGGTWYPVSGWYLWKVHLKFKKRNESEATWGLDFNNDGDTNDTVAVWRNFGSLIGLDDSGF